MHADELNTALTEEYRKPIYHYHLHVISNVKKYTEIDIYYRGVGIISFPVSLDDIEITIKKILNKKTA